MYVKTITLNLLKTDLKDFYVNCGCLSVADIGFQKFFKDALSDCAIAQGEKLTYHFHTTFESAHDKEIITRVGEKIIDLSTAAGKVEARRRISFLKHLIKEQRQGKANQLLANGYRNAIGWFKLESGDVVAVGCYYFPGGHQWRCITWPLQQRSAGGYYISGNVEVMVEA